GRRVIALLTIAPRRWISKIFAYSRPLPNVPEAVITGFERARPRLWPGRTSTLRLGTFSMYAPRWTKNNGPWQDRACSFRERPKVPYARVAAHGWPCERPAPSRLAS